MTRGLLPALVLWSALAAAEERDGGSYAQFLSEVRRIYWDKSKTDEEIVRELTSRLDAAISSRAGEDRRREVLLIWLIARRADMTKPRGRPDAIRAVLRSIDSYKNPAEIRDLLSISLALARGDGTPSEPLIRLLECRETNQQILVPVLEALAPNPPPRSVPRLLELSSHPWSHGPVTDVGPAKQKVYPVREGVAACLRSLEIEVKIDDEGRIKMSRNSLLAKLRDWVLTDDPQTWQQAAHVIRQLSEEAEDVKRLRSELLANPKLPSAKRDVLAAKSEGGNDNKK